VFLDFRKGVEHGGHEGKEKTGRQLLRKNRGGKGKMWNLRNAGEEKREKL